MTSVNDASIDAIPVDGSRIPFTFYDHLPDGAGLIAGRPARFDIDTGSRSELD